LSRGLTSQRRGGLPPLGVLEAGTSRSQPEHSSESSRVTVCVEQGYGLLGIEPLPQGIPPNLLARNLAPIPRPNPPQHPPSINVPLRERDLPKRRPRVRPEIIPDKLGRRYRD
jgi:hypothetical protein